MESLRKQIERTSTLTALQNEVQYWSAEIHFAIRYVKYVTTLYTHSRPRALLFPGWTLRLRGRSPGIFNRVSTFEQEILKNSQVADRLSTPLPFSPAKEKRFLKLENYETLVVLGFRRQINRVFVRKASYRWQIVSCALRYEENVRYLTDKFWKLIKSIRFLNCACNCLRQCSCRVYGDESRNTSRFSYF